MVFFWLLVLSSFPLSLRAERLPVKTYTVADGLLRDYVYKIRQDSQGFLWFCTPGGISRFDGYAFTNFTTDDGLPDRHVESSEFFLEIADDGRGFDVSRSSDGNGLANMKSRAAKIGGTFSVSSEPQGGTRITVHARA